jgi:hypothetical protein
MLRPPQPSHLTKPSSDGGVERERPLEIADPQAEMQGAHNEQPYGLLDDGRVSMTSGPGAAPPLFAQRPGNPGVNSPLNLTRRTG